MTDIKIMNQKKLDAFAEQVSALVKTARVLFEKERFTDIAPILDELSSFDDQLYLQANINLIREVIELSASMISIGDYQRLDSLMNKMFQIIQQHDHREMRDTFITLYNIGVLYNAAQDNDARSQVYSMLISSAEQLETPIDNDTAMVFFELAEVYRNAGYPKAVAMLCKPLYPYVMSSPKFNPEARFSWVQRYALTLSEDGQFDTALGVLSDAIKVVETVPELDDSKQVTILTIMDHIARTKGDVQAAQVYIDRAKQQIDEKGLSDCTIAAVIYHNQATLYNQQESADKYNEAEMYAKRALAIYKKINGVDSPEYAGELAQLAVIVEKKGELERAIDLYSQSFIIYESAEDAYQSEYSDFLTDAGGLYLRLQRYNEAAQVYQKALNLREREKNREPDRVVNTISNLATAHFKAGRLDVATPLFRQAIDLRHQMQSVT